MGRFSTKKDKSIYQLAREAMSLTREKASELIGYISPERIEKIENAKVSIQPEDVLAMAECYKSPNLCNHYCSNECPIGQQCVPEIQSKDLSQIAVETLNGLNRMNRDKDRLLEIVEDGQITPDEYADFVSIKHTLDKISLTVNTLQLWIDQMVADGKIDPDILK